MHWVDMEWLWGYHVLSGSIRDMLHFCRETGAKGNVNFDGIGYEKLAAEDPEALAALREAVQNGTIEVVGASYGQPYGLFHGGESNIRQRIYGARAVRRLLGVWPKTFWEEEFDFFPQLPQMLRGVGFEYASLFFQWTWHTPEILKEEVPVIWWEGIDGSRLLTATRNRLNLHQWPEDVQILMDELADDPPEGERLILQWLELMPSPDWMCRSEVLLPKTKELLSDSRFDVKFGTLSDYLRTWDRLPGDATVPVRRYTMDDAWHGMSLGKNADRAPRASHYAERCLLQTESLNAVLGLLGRPYDNWDVYPVWELEEGWRNLLAAQHHDNHECEGLCGHVAQPQYATVAQLTKHGSRGMLHLCRRLALSRDEAAVFNALGWPKREALSYKDKVAVVEVPAFSYRIVQRSEFVKRPRWHLDGLVATFERDPVRVRLNFEDRTISIQTSEADWSGPMPHLQWLRDGQMKTSGAVLRERIENDGYPALFVSFECEADFMMSFTVPDEADALDVGLHIHHTDGEQHYPLKEGQWWPDPGMNAGIQAVWIVGEGAMLVGDSPYAVHALQPAGPWPRKYPLGDWMTSPQWFETIENAFTAQTFVNLGTPNGELLIIHDGSQQWFLNAGELRNLLNMLDPWDEGNAAPNANVRYRLIPHRGKPNSEIWRLGRELFGSVSGLPNRLLEWGMLNEPASLDRPPSLAENTLRCSPTNVCATAFYRELEDYSGKHLEAYAGCGMSHPYVLRLVEFDGEDTDVELTLAGTVAAAYKTNLLGEITEHLRPNTEHHRSTISFHMRAHEIATIYLDIVEGRKQTRDLDAARNVWATVHRVEDE